MTREPAIAAAVVRSPDNHRPAGPALSAPRRCSLRADPRTPDPRPVQNVNGCPGLLCRPAVDDRGGRQPRDRLRNMWRAPRAPHAGRLLEWAARGGDDRAVHYQTHVDGDRVRARAEATS